jgi:hypothetical protein
MPDEAQPATATPAPAATPAPEAAPPAAAAPESIFDAAGSTPATPPAGQAQRPDWVQEPFWDPAKGEVRVESLAKAYTDMRARVARGEGKVPEAPEAYALPAVEGVAPDLVPDTDPVWTEVRKAAHAAHVTEAQLHAVVKPYLAAVAKMAPAKPAPADEAAAQAAREAELRAEIGKLGPNGVQMVRDIGGRIAGMQARGAITAEEARALKAIGTADGVRALAKLFQLNGEQPIPIDALSEDSVTVADAQRMLRDGYAKKDDALVAKGQRALRELQKRGPLAAG